VRAHEVRLGRILHGAASRVHEAVGALGRGDHGQGVRIGIGVIGQDRHGDRHAGDGLGGVVVGHGRRVGDVDGDGGDVAVKGTVEHVVGEGVVSREAGVGSVAEPAVASNVHGAVARVVHKYGGQRVEVEIHRILEQAVGIVNVHRLALVDGVANVVAAG